MLIRMFSKVSMVFKLFSHKRLVGDQQDLLYTYRIRISEDVSWRHKGFVFCSFWFGFGLVFAVLGIEPGPPALSKSLTDELSPQPDIARSQTWS